MQKLLFKHAWAWTWCGYRFNVSMRLYLHPFFVCVGRGAVKALMRLSACVATSKRWHLIGYTISTNNLIRWPIFLQSGHIIIEKLKLYVMFEPANEGLAFYRICVHFFFKYVWT